MESVGKISLLEAIAGRIEKFPPEYYLRRIEIAKAKIAKNPNDLLAYDDIAVAFDRLGNDQDALTWISKKRNYLGSASSDDLYRTESNEATFLVHLWFAHGSKESNSQLLEKSIARLKKALEINPNAHFGREVVQLELVKWILECCKDKNESKFEPTDLLSHLQYSKIPEEKLIEGLVGLMALGSVWESLDVIASLAGLRRKDGNIIEFARLRMEELFESGKRGLFKDKPYMVRSMIYDPAKENVHDNFLRFRKNADQFQDKLNQFVNSQLQKGKHPDTDPKFWDGYTPVEHLEVSDLSLPQNAKFWLHKNVALVIIAVVFGTPLILFFVIRGISRRMKKRSTLK